MEKKIVGYNVKREYITIVSRILNSDVRDVTKEHMEGCGFHYGLNSRGLEEISNVNLVDIVLEPVYGKEKVQYSRWHPVFRNLVTETLHIRSTGYYAKEDADACGLEDETFVESVLIEKEIEI